MVMVDGANKQGTGATSPCRTGDPERVIVNTDRHHKTFYTSIHCFSRGTMIQ